MLGYLLFIIMLTMILIGCLIAPTVASTEVVQIQELERILDEYRKLVSPTEVKKSSAEDTETVKRLNEEKSRLAQQVQELNRNVESLQGQLEVAISRV